ncbi:hypothetical protein DEJ13_16535 [Curtobacterium sp. MCLR17_007]|uniref:hypothetical protein n=1 Tax=Curtobacterium sp. MCLR17_007 TaxID=2175648 RepID=UPI000DA85DE9|nr:hypothetical protein [Curtobacterium sp. MCLR17_007]WIB60023.1 hypothetical protein DEJ13_16535 [Curtobacterium sp. MCLR17_007]
MSADTMSTQTRRPAPVRRPTRPTRASRPLLADREDAPVWMRVTGAALLVAGGGLTAAVLAWPGDAPEIALVVPGLVGMVVGLLLLVARSGFTITEHDVVLHFRPLPPRRVARRRITAARLVEADAATYGGIGLRRHRGVRALLLTPGLGIELTDDRGTVTFVRTRRPEDAFRALAGHRAPAAGAGAASRERLG